MSTRPAGSTLSRLLTNGAWNGLSTVASGAVAFLLVPLLLQSLGRDVYGIWVLIGSMFAYASVLHFGLSSAINRHVPVALARGDEDAVRRVVTTGTAFFAGVGGVVLLATLLLQLGFASWFNVPVPMHDEARRAVLVVGGLLALTVSFQGFGAALSGYQRYDLPAMSRIAMLVIRCAVLWTLVRSGAGLVTVAWTFGLTELGVNVLQFIFGRRLMPRHVLAPRHFEPALLREMLAYGGNTFLYSAGAVIAYKASEVVVGVLQGPVEVAGYSVAATGVLTLSAIVESFSAALKPAVSDLDARDQAHTIRALSLAAQKFALLVILPSTAFLVLMGSSFLRLWTGSDLEEVAAVMALLAVGQAFRLAQQSNFLVLVGKGEHRFFGLAVLGVGALTIGLTLIAVGPLGLGVVGAAGASCISWAIIAGIVIPAHVNTKLGIARGERWRAVIGPALAGVAPGIAAMMIWRAVRAPDSWLEIALMIVIVAALTGAVAWSVTLTDAERQRLARIGARIGLGAK